MTGADWVEWISWAILAIGLLQNVIYTVQLPAAWNELRAHSQADDTESSWELLISHTTLPISLLVPAYQEEATIVSSVRSMLALKYPQLELIVINDGSKDRTLERLIEAFSLDAIARAHDLAVPHAPIRGIYGSPAYPQLIVVDKENGGKADAINAGINIARNPLFCVVDADSVLEGEALLRAVRPFMEDPQRMVAVGGAIRILNGCTVKAGQVTKVGLPRQFLPLLQTMEYVRAFLMARLAWSRWGMLTLISGAFGIFRRDIAIAVGGFSHNTVGEDYELVIKMHRWLQKRKQDYAMRYVPEPVCWTEAPDTLAILGNQRKRWQRGALEVFFKHRAVCFNPHYGKLGIIGFPHNMLADVLGPLAELIGYAFIPFFWYMGFLNTSFLLAFLAVFLIYGVFVSVSCLILEEMELKRFPKARDLAVLGLVSIVENFGYRQLNNFWRIVGWWQFLRKQKSWGTMTRRGF